MFEFTTLAHFIEVYSNVNALVVNALVVDAQSIIELIDGSAKDLAVQNVRYAEMTTTPYSHVIGAGIACGDVREALGEGRRLARRRSVEFAWVCDVAGEMGLAATQLTLDVALNDPPEGLVALGLSGIEAGVDDRARAAGLRSVPHAGEGDRPPSVWAALGFLRADRIGHGVRARSRIRDSSNISLNNAFRSRSARRRTSALASTQPWPTTRSVSSSAPERS